MSTTKRRFAGTLAAAAITIGGGAAAAAPAHAQCSSYGTADVCVSKNGAYFQASYYTYHRSAKNDKGRLWLQQCRGDRTGCVQWSGYVSFTAPNYSNGYFDTPFVQGSYGHIYRAVVEGSDVNGGYVRTSPFVAY